MRFPASLAAPVLLLALAVPARADFLLSVGKETVLLLNRTPAIFLTDPPGAKTDLKARARARIDGKSLRVTLSWEDPTEDAVAGAKRAAYGSDPIYRKPTEKTDRFGDAAAMMVPAEKGARFPGIMMGDPEREVRREPPATGTATSGTPRGISSAREGPGGRTARGGAEADPGSAGPVVSPGVRTARGGTAGPAPRFRLAGRSRVARLAGRARSRQAPGGAST